MTTRPAPAYSPFRWNSAAGRYIGPDGLFVARTRVVAALETVQAASGARMAGLARALQRGDLTLAEWQIGMAHEIRTVHLVAAAVGAGGWDRLGPAEWGRVGRLTRDQYAYLQRFALEIEAGLPLDGRFVARAQTYALAPRRTQSQMERLGALRRGQTHERNILGSADHCPGCLAATRQGVVPIGTLAPIGTRDCLVHCRCSIEFSREAA